MDQQSVESFSDGSNMALMLICLTSWPAACVFLPSRDSIWNVQLWQRKNTLTLRCCCCLDLNWFYLQSVTNNKKEFVVREEQQTVRWIRWTLLTKNQNHLRGTPQLYTMFSSLMFWKDSQGFRTLKLFNFRGAERNM